MATTLKTLGQVVPTANTLTTLYTVPANTSTSCSSLTVCNQNNNTSGAFRMSVAINGAADTPAQYYYFNLPISNNDTFIATIGISLNTGDVVRVYSTIANMSFNLTGVEVT